MVWEGIRVEFTAGIAGHGGVEVRREVGVEFVRDGVGAVFVAAGCVVLTRCDEVVDVEAAFRRGCLWLKVIEVRRVFDVVNRRLAIGALLALVAKKSLADFAFAGLE